MKRSAPKEGYDFAAKAQYRKQVWKVLLDQSEKPRQDLRCLILPSSEGLEIPLLIEQGVREENIFAVDKNAAVLATAPWRERYPRVRIYGNELPRAAERLRDDAVVIDCANLDLCANLSVAGLRELQHVAATLPLASMSGLALTMLKGRELNDIFALFALSHFDDRLDVACRAFNVPDRALSTVLSGEYPSGTQYMQWRVLRVRQSADQWALVWPVQHLYDSCVCRGTLNWCHCGNKHPHATKLYYDGFYETADEARRAEQVWRDHPHWMYVDATHVNNGAAKAPTVQHPKLVTKAEFLGMKSRATATHMMPTLHVFPVELRGAFARNLRRDYAKERAASQARYAEVMATVARHEARHDSTCPALDGALCAECLDEDPTGETRRRMLAFKRGELERGHVWDGFPNGYPNVSQSEGAAR